MQEIIRKDKNGTVLNVGDLVEIEDVTGAGTGEIVDCPGGNLSWDNSNHIWIKWQTGTGDRDLHVGYTFWNLPMKVTLLKRKAQPHVHAELIKAWADDPAGVVIQHLNKLRGEWLDVLNNTPLWDTKTQYRIKPKTQKVKKYNFSYRNKFGIIQTSIQRFTEEDFKKQFVDSGACTEYVRLDFSMQEIEV